MASGNRTAPAALDHGQGYPLRRSCPDRDFTTIRAYMTCPKCNSGLVVANGSVVHVLPVNDLIEHEEEGDECVCGPDVEFVPGGEVITHHSLDGREGHEPDAR